MTSEERDRKCRPEDLNETEWEVLLQLVESSEGNGHDFCFTDELTCVAPERRSGYVSQLVQKGYLTSPVKHIVNQGTPWAESVTQAELTERTFRELGI